MEQVKISVRNLVEFILRSGDIDNRRGRGLQKEAMQEGTRIHQKIQRRMGASYHAEVPLKIELDKGNYLLVVEGRADGIIIEEDRVTIDEIKGMYLDVNGMEAPIEVHLAQAKCYAWIYAYDQDLKEIGVQMTYCSLETEEIRRYEEIYPAAELETWFGDLVEQYQQWADYQYEQKKTMKDSIRGIEFPYPYREGQRELAVGVYRTLAREKLLFIQAPTGTGKTISTVFPAVKAVGQGMAEKIFYLTARTITRTVAREAFELLGRQGYRGSVITLTAKEKLCLCDGEMDCNPDHCRYALGHYDRVNDAVFDLLQKTREITRERLLEQAEESLVCPFELCLDVSLWVDVIICDYNYVFDPNVFLKRFFAEGIRGDYIFLIDEAHNLVERGRSMYSAVLYKEDFLTMKKIFKGLSGGVMKKLEQCNHHLLEMKRCCETYLEIDGIGQLLFALMNLMTALDEFFKDCGDFSEKKETLEFYLNLRHFLNMYDRLDENYVVYTRHEADGRFLLKLYCVNPSVNLQACLNKGKSSVFFSATLLPVQYYKSLLSTREDNYAVYAKSVFSQKQRLLLVANDVSSKYKRRNETEFDRIAAYIDKTVSFQKGNYMVFFPSYKLMEQVYDRFFPLCVGRVECLLQEPGMGERERERFLEEFSAKRDGSLAGFCVMGGIFSEGIDLKREQLIGAIVVGTGLPQISDEREILKQHYDRKTGGGFAYAFRYPGMNKVLQAAGRVIRTAEDRGVILLLDERFLQREYQELFPLEWEDYQVCSIETLEENLARFWLE